MLRPFCCFSRALAFQGGEYALGIEGASGTFQHDDTAPVLLHPDGVGSGVPDGDGTSREFLDPPCRAPGETGGSA